MLLEEHKDTNTDRDKSADHYRKDLIKSGCCDSLGICAERIGGAISSASSVQGEFACGAG
jgi:hypothetical protein